MFGTEHLSLFLASSWLLILSPGQDTLYIVGRSLSQGQRAGLISVFGIVTGAFVHAFAAAFGVSAILATSARAYLVVKLAGAAYLAYLGVMMMIERETADGEVVRFADDRPWAIYRAGLLTNLSNVKVALFFMAFLPQFVAPTSGSRVLSLLFLGVLFILNGALWCLVLVWGASTLGRRLLKHPSGGVMFKRATGALWCSR
jgi:threonine/homoserine/homoserine lactone efflux protein